MGPERWGSRLTLRRIVSSALALTLSACLQWCPPKVTLSPIPDNDLVSLVDSSAVGFVGKVIARGATTTAAAPRSRLTATVRALEILPPESLSIITAGDVVTLEMSARDTASLFEGVNYAFLANGVSLDTGVVLAEVALLDASSAKSRSAAANRIRAARIAAEDARLQQHLAQADVVLLGAVRSVARAATRDSSVRSRRVVGEAQWKIGQIAVRYSWRGDTAMLRYGIPLLFPGSSHIRWAGAPRLRPGDSALYLAHRGTLPTVLRSGRDSTAFFVLHEIDVHTVAESSRVARLLKSPARRGKE
jgi:hypothetical protein